MAQLPHNLIPRESLSRRRRSNLAAGVDATMNARDLYVALISNVEGDVLFDDSSRRLYAQDASNYRHLPIGVVVPRSSADVAATLRVCHGLRLPVTSRGGGTALAGQTINEAVVLDFSRYMNRIVALDARRRRATVEPGVVCDQLVDASRPHGLTWGPKPATHSHCCFGGMLANNCGGMHAQYAGLAVANVNAMRVLLYDGTELDLGWMTERELEQSAAQAGRRGTLFRELRRFRQRHERLIREKMPHLARRVSGYALDQLLPADDGRFNLARALVGSEGTCATVLEAEVDLVDFYPHRVVVAVGYDDVYQAADHAADVLEFQPLAVEGMDDILYQHIIDKKMRQRQHLDLLPTGRGWLLVELGAHEARALDARTEALVRRVTKAGQGRVSTRVIRRREQQEQLWGLREAGLGATAFVPGQPDTWPGFEDSAVRVEQLGEYLRDLRVLFDRHGFRPALYGHFGMGCVHCRIPFDLQSREGVRRYRAFVEDAADLVAGKYGGTLSGEHGDGQARGELLMRMFGPELLQAFGEFKAIWDPDRMMNPGRIVDPAPLDQDLRLGANYQPTQTRTRFSFSDDQGSFARATLRCVGVGKCRRTSGTSGEDTMCPSYMVTHDERHSTRGRSHLLWELLRGGGLPSDHSVHSDGVKEALDLCLSCKGCKSECPVNVDMATYKAEFLSQYHQTHPRSRSAFAFGFIDRWARVLSKVPTIANFATQTPGLSRLARWVAGATQHRALPPFAPVTFRDWFLRRKGRPTASRRVMLWTDTFNNYFHPETAKAAVEVLERIGYQVSIPPRVVCCGRPLYEYGFLERARGRLEHVVDVLTPALSEGLPIVVLEPSCCSVFRDELEDILPGHDGARALSQRVVLLSELLQDDLERLPRLQRQAIVHGHCHHKSVLGFDAERRVFEAMQLDAHILNSGCCGLAGAFGFERDKYEVAQACGERALLPSVREQADGTLIVANGFSCRNQIAHGSDRRALHLAQVLKLAWEHGPVGPATLRPESAVT